MGHAWSARVTLLDQVNAFVGRAATATDVFAYLLIAFVVCLVLTTLVFAGKSMKLRWEKRLPPAPLPASAGVMRRCLELLAPVRVPRASALFASSKRASFVVRRKVGAEGGSLPLAMNPIARSEIIEAMRGADDGEAAWAPGVTTPRGRAASDELPAGWTVVEDDDGEVRVRSCMLLRAATVCARACRGTTSTKPLARHSGTAQRRRAGSLAVARPSPLPWRGTRSAVFSAPRVHWLCKLSCAAWIVLSALCVRVPRAAQPACSTSAY